MSNLDSKPDPEPDRKPTTPTEAEAGDAMALAQNMLASANLPDPSSVKASLDRFEPVHEVDYLIDHYAILKISDEIRELALRGEHTEKELAQIDSEIKTAYRKEAMAYHPDRLATLAEDLQAQATYKFKLITKANDVLSDRDQRSQYNALLKKFQEEDPRLISREGHPIVNPLRKSISIDQMLNEDDGDVSQFEGLILSTTGYNEVTFNLLKEQFEKDENPSDALREAYRDQLEKRAAYLEAQEEIAWRKAGVANQDTVSIYTSPEHLAERVESLIEETKSSIQDRVGQRLLALDAGLDRPLLLPGGSEVTEQDTQQNLPQLRAEIEKTVLDSFSKRSERIREIAGLRAETLEARSDFVKYTYLHREPQSTNALVILLGQAGTIHAAYLGVLEENNANLTDVSLEGTIAIADFNLEQLRTGQPKLENLSPDVALLDIDPSLDLGFQIATVAGKHFDELEGDGYCCP